MPFRRLIRAWLVALLLVGGWPASRPPLAWGQDELTRRTKSKVTPGYPEMAQRMKIAGVVRVMVTVAPDGSIKETRLIGGHPLLGNAALDAIKKWRFASAPGDSTGVVEFRFDPKQ